MQSKLTTRSQEAITAAQRLAVSRGQAALEPPRHGRIPFRRVVVLARQGHGHQAVDD